MQRAIVLAVLITPTHSSFIIKLHILIAPVELAHFTVWILYGEGVEVVWVFFYVLSIFLRLMTSRSLNKGEELSC